MSKEVSWHVELAVKPGQLQSFRELTAEMVELTRRESGVLTYQRFVSDDGTLVYVYERYADSAAALAHLRIFAENFSHRFAAWWNEGGLRHSVCRAMSYRQRLTDLARLI